ncbi:MAG TPA: cell wall-binding repeat-containing protein, partial [Egibacteraceae bacterium]|nr:cell wall-binding repeat-containing protein [Egibacteraceae bacterium]
APPPPASDRLAGGDRYATAAAISAASRRPGVDRVYVGTGRQYPDALAAGPAAAASGGSVLLTAPTALPPSTAAELARLQPSEIVLAGGFASVSTDVAQALSRYGPVRRVAGGDRYSTAAAIARDAFDGPVPVLYLASGRNFPDALAGGAAAAAQGAPLLLTEPSRLPDATEQAIRALRPAHIVVLGGPTAITDGVLSTVASYAGSVTRVFGTNRFATSGEVSRWTFPGQTNVVYLATGLEFPDALAGGPAAGAHDSPLLLVRPDALPPAAAAELARLRPRHVVALGGTSAVSAATLAAAKAAAGH